MSRLRAAIVATIAVAVAPTTSIAANPDATPLSKAVSKAVSKVVAAGGIGPGYEVIASKGDAIVFYGGDVGDDRHAALWRWASVTKQVIATLVLQEVAAGHIDLDQPVARYLPKFASPNAGLVTVRQLLRHQSGLPNPDNTAPDANSPPAYDLPGYKGSRDPLTGYCAGPVAGPPGANWTYNNCDYIVAGALLQAVTGKSWQKLVQQRITKPLGLKTLGAFPTPKRTVSGTIDGKPEPAYDLAGFAASAALYGTARDLWAFDRALMTGKLLPDAQRAQMWDGQPKLGFIALGQWVFTVPLKGCAAPVTIVERRGGIGGVEVRNFILPDKDVVVIAFVNRAGFDFGEVWQGKGFSHDLLAAAACP